MYRNLRGLPYRTKGFGPRVNGEAAALFGRALRWSLKWSLHTSIDADWLHFPANKSFGGQSLGCYRNTTKCTAAHKGRAKAQEG
jgi:hypothetical protein